MASCLIALGGNVGDVRGRFARALELLEGDGTRVVAVSGWVRSTPMGSEAGGEFVNGAARLETVLSPEGMLARLHEVETALDRRREGRWGPRTIDLDLVSYGLEVRGERFETGDSFTSHLSPPTSLKLPHPGCWWRRFVLDPVVEIAGEDVYPVTGETFLQLRERLLGRPFVVGVSESVPEEWLDEVRQRLGMLGREVEWSRSECQAAIRLETGSSVNSPGQRRLGVPGDRAGFVEMGVAVLVASLGVGDWERGA